MYGFFYKHRYCAVNDLHQSTFCLVHDVMQKKKKTIETEFNGDRQTDWIECEKRNTRFNCDDRQIKTNARIAKKN